MKFGAGEHRTFLPQRGCGKLLPRGGRPAVALVNPAVEHSTQRGAVGCGGGVRRRPQPHCGCSSVRTLNQGRPAGPVAQTFQSAGCGDFPVPTRNWKVPRTRRLESLRYEQGSDRRKSFRTQSRARSERRR